MPAPQPQSPRLPSWLLTVLGIVASICIGLTSTAYNAAKENEHRITQLEADAATHRAWAVETKAAADARIRELEQARMQEREEFRRLLSDVREDVAAIRGALRIPKN